jgi:hypothetical protein
VNDALLTLLAYHRASPPAAGGADGQDPSYRVLELFRRRSET